MADEQAIARPFEVGDAVLFDETLYRVEALGEDEDGIFATLRNENEECQAAIEDLTFIAKDTLSGMKPKKKAVKYPFKWGAWVRHKPSGLEGRVSHNRNGETHVEVWSDTGHTMYAWPPDELEKAKPPRAKPLPPLLERGPRWPEDWEHPAPPPKPSPQDADSISTGALITDEVKRLRREESEERRREANKPSTRRKLHTRPPGARLTKPAVDEPEPSEDKPSGIPKRRGDW